MNSKKTILLTSLILLLSIFLLDVPQLRAQGVDVSTAAGTKKERKMKLISDVKIPLEDDGANYDFKMVREKGGLQLIAKRKDKQEREIFDKKGEKVRTETINEEEANKIVLTSSKSYSPMLDGAVGNWIINFPNGVKAKVPLGHIQSISPNHKYVFTFPGSGADYLNNEDWYIRLYDSSGKVLWEYSDLPHHGDFPVFWSSDDDYFAILVDETVHVFSRNGREWSYKSDDEEARGITGVLIADRAAKVGFSVCYQLDLSASQLIEMAREGKKKGLAGWISAENPCVFHCFDKKGKLLWHKRFSHAGRYFSNDGRYILYLDRSADSLSEVLQIFNTDTGDMVHEQVFSPEDSLSKHAQILREFDVEGKQLVFFLVEATIEKGGEWIPFMGGFSYKESGRPSKRQIHGFRMTVYDLSDVLP